MIRRAQPEDNLQISSIMSEAFKSSAEAEIIRHLHRKNDDISAWVLLHKGKLIGAIQFYKISLKNQPVAGLGPVGINPEFQRKGFGTTLIKKAIQALKDETDYPLLFVIGHPEFYPRFGFSTKLGNQFIAPWSGPSFMAMPLKINYPQDGTLTFPKAFG